MQKFYFGLLLSLAVLVSGKVNGQGSRYCAESHRRSAARQAQTTAGQQKLMAKYDVVFYKLDVALERTSTFISGNALIKTKSRVAALDTFAFELHPNLTLDSVLINGQKKTFTRQGSFTIVKLTPAITLGNNADALIYYKGTPPAAQSAAIGAGMTSDVSQAWGNRATWSLSQPFSAYEWFPVKQDLTDKADSSEVWVSTSNTNKVGSNGLLKRTVTLPNNKVRYEWKSRYPIDYYLISVSVSDYIEVNQVANPVGAPNPVLIQNYIYSNPATLAQFQNDILDTKPLLEKYSELYGLYPFHKEKYGHCMAPFSGGMEHQTMTTQGLFEFTLTGHELAHQWFGDNVTCGSWRDIWLNESFASYSEYLALETLRSGQQRGWMNNTHSSVMSQAGGSVYVPAADSTDVNRIFDSRLTYDKGAAVIHMLRFEMNSDTLFFRTLKRYQQQYKNSTARTQNFKQVAETVSGKNLTTFFNQWIYGEGYPIFSLTWNQTGKNFILRSTQTVSRANITPFFETDVEFRLTRTTGDTIIRVKQDQPVEFYTIHLNGTVTGIQIDPNQWILNGNGSIVKDTNLVNGVKEALAKAKQVLYPNPATTYIQISEQLFLPERFELWDVAGRCIKKGSFQPANLRLDVSELESGTYILKTFGDQKSAASVFTKL